MRRVAVGLVLMIAASAACTKQEASDPTQEGQVEVGDVASAVIDAECAEPGATLYGSGVAAGEDESRLVTFDVVVDDEVGQASIRVLRGDEVDEQFVAADAEVTRTDGAGDAGGSDEELTLRGTFTSFDGPTQTGEVDGSIRFTCAPDTDPGGGSLHLDSQQVDYDLVVCLETPDGYEARAWRTDEPNDQVTLRRTLLLSGWVDRVNATGSVSADTDRALDNGDGSAVDVAEGLFVVRGSRVTAASSALGDGQVGSIDVTCGIDLTTRTD